MTQHVAMALLHFLWQGTLVALVLAVILRLLRDQVPSDQADEKRGSTRAPSTRANVRYVIACLGLLAMAALPVVNLLLIEPPAHTAANLDSVSEHVTGEPNDVSGNLGHDPGPVAASEMSHGPPTAVSEPISLAPYTVVAEPVSAEDTVAEVSPFITESAVSTASPWLRFVLQWTFWTWLVGVAFLGAWHVVAWVLSQRLRCGGVTPPDEVLTLVRKMARRLGIRRTVSVRQTLKVTAPMVIGWIKPVLILPASILSGLAPHELEAVLAHELAHIRRHDYLVNLLQAVVETLLFYHPAVWWLSHRIRCEREFCADDIALGVCQGRDVYARSLVALAELVRTPPAHAVAATGGRFLTRMRRIMHLPEQRPRPGRCAVRSALVAVAATACLGFVLLAVARSQPTGDAASREEARSHDGVADASEKERDQPARERDAPSNRAPENDEQQSVGSAIVVRRSEIAAPSSTTDGRSPPGVPSQIRRGELRINNIRTEGNLVLFRLNCEVEPDNGWYVELIYECERDSVGGQVHVPQGAVVLKPQARQAWPDTRHPSFKLPLPRDGLLIALACPDHAVQGLKSVLSQKAGRNLYASRPFGPVDLLLDETSPAAKLPVAEYLKQGAYRLVPNIFKPAQPNVTLLKDGRIEASSARGRRPPECQYPDECEGQPGQRE
jgi:beta-lactamase regulating signal transducer with metallopeptidase domain